jgi:hypothetical protein
VLAAQIALGLLALSVLVAIDQIWSGAPRLCFSRFAQICTNLHN